MIFRLINRIIFAKYFLETFFSKLLSQGQEELLKTLVIKRNYYVVELFMKKVINF